MQSQFHRAAPLSEGIETPFKKAIVPKLVEFISIGNSHRSTKSDRDSIRLIHSCVAESPGLRKFVPIAILLHPMPLITLLSRWKRLQTELRSHCICSTLESDILTVIRFPRRAMGSPALFVTQPS